LRIIHKNIHQ